MRVDRSKSLAFALALALTVCAPVYVSAAATPDAQAVQLNNNGVALMNQQQTEHAEAAFAEAARKDKTIAYAALNDGIALLYMQKLTESEAALKRAGELAPDSPRVWYNLGLVERAANDISAALASFKRASELDPNDADSLYFEGVCLQDEKQFLPAIEVFTKALTIDSQHASSEFALARALQRSGKADEAKAHFIRFQHLTSTKVSSAMGLSYGDQGRYSTAVPIMQTSSTGTAPIPVKFSQQALVDSAVQRKDSALEKSSGGTCMLDVDGDGSYDLVLTRSGRSALRVLSNHGGKFTELPLADTGLLLSGNAISCAAGDFDSDGLADLAVAMEDRVVLLHNLGHGHFEDISQAAGLSARNSPRGITFADYDHDGDLDLFITGSAKAAGQTANVLWRNNGNKTFTEWTEQTGLSGEGRTEAPIFSDVNSDRAVDIVVTGDQKSPLVYRNPREGKFPSKPLYGAQDLPATLGVTALDFNKDGWMDLAVTHSGAPGITLWKNQGGQAFERVDLPIHDAVKAYGVIPIDYDNDGWVDIAVLVETARGPEVRMLRNRGDGSFEDVSSALGLDKVVLTASRALIAMDVDGDGDADLIVTSTSGDPILLRNEGGNKNHSLRLQLKGFADNKTAIGTKVEAFSNTNWQKWEVTGASGYLSQGPPEVLVGLGSSESVDLLRLLWPTGVPQDEISVAQKPVVTYQEADRRGSSCPVLFAWDGKRYGLVTDTIGAAVVGHWFTPKRRNLPDADEWIKVDGSQLVETKGKLSLRFTEPMEEVNYIDQMRLKAIDHPEGTEVYPDEKFLDEPPFASGKAVLSHAAKPVVGAWDGQDKNVLAEIMAKDHRFVSNFNKLPYDGFANKHSLTLDLGSWDVSRPLRLFLTGYVEYFSATSLYAAWQAGVTPISPFVEVQLADGSWKRVGREMGFPAGLERTIVADLSGQLPANSRKIRITTNLQIYWDQILVDNGTELKSEMKVQETPLSRAALRFHGYPKQIDGVSPGDLGYDYDQVSLTGPFQRQRGSYTRFGDVTPLVSNVDNKFAIFGSGEEIAAEFDATQLPPLPAHWKRDYFFYANGYVKDMDFYDGSPFTVSQMPFHSMSQYPYPANESYPEDAQSIEYQLNWNDRYDRGEPSQQFRFDYQLRPSTPSDLDSPAKADERN